jgi:hypothetical protein
MASFSSILSNIGHGLKVFFAGAVKVAVAAEPLVDVAFPGIAGLYNATVNEVAKAEGLAIAAGSQSGTGPQKLSLVVQAIESEFDAYAKANGITYDASHIEAWVNAVVTSLNVIPAGTS